MEYGMSPPSELRNSEDRRTSVLSRLSALGTPPVAITKITGHATCGIMQHLLWLDPKLRSGGMLSNSAKLTFVIL